jgi:hypothetical protein
MRGGGVGAGYSVGPAVLVPGMPYLVNDGSVGNCQAVAPSYAIPPASASALHVGLPGMGSGGILGLFKGGGRSRKRRSQRGGRYDGLTMAYPGPVIGTTTGGVVRIPCEAGQGSPQPSPTVPTEPPVAARADMPTQSMQSAGILPGYSGAGGRRMSKRRKMRGGALQAPYSGSPVLQETTAGYTHFRSGSDFESNTQSGVPFMFNVADGGRLGVPNACVTLGGGTANVNLGNTGLMRGGRHAVPLTPSAKKMRRNRKNRNSHRNRNRK